MPFQNHISYQLQTLAELEMITHLEQHRYEIYTVPFDVIQK